MREPYNARFSDVEVRAGNGRWSQGDPYVVCGRVYVTNSREGGPDGMRRFVYTYARNIEIATIDDLRSHVFETNWIRGCVDGASGP